MKLSITKTTVLDLPDYGTHLYDWQLVELVKRSGSHFFDKDTMRGFKSRLYDVVFTGKDGWYFITSEKHEWHTSYGSGSDPRKYTIRRLRPNTAGDDLRLDTLGEFQQYPTLKRAITAARRFAKDGALVCDHCTGTPHHDTWCPTLQTEEK